jgi:hypothetical protein
MIGQIPKKKYFFKDLLPFTSSKPQKTASHLGLGQESEIKSEFGVYFHQAK